MTSTAPLVRVYVAALSGRALYVSSAMEGQVSRLGFEPEPRFEVFAVLWFAKPAHAQLVEMRCHDDLVAIGAMRPHGWIDLRPQTVKQKVTSTARLLGAFWQTQAEMERDAENVVVEVLGKIEEMRKNGGLAEINARYKNYRFSQLAKSEKAISYTAYVALHTQSLVAAAAQKMSGG